MAAKKKPQKRARSAKTGRFVSLRYAFRHPFTTIVESVKRLGE
jgi:hypothetical protein